MQGETTPNRSRSIPRSWDLVASPDAPRAGARRRSRRGRHGHRRQGALPGRLPDPRPARVRGRRPLRGPFDAQRAAARVQGAALHDDEARRRARDPHREAHHALQARLGPIHPVQPHVQAPRRLEDRQRAPELPARAGAEHRPTGAEHEPVRGEGGRRLRGAAIGQPRRVVSRARHRRTASQIARRPFVEEWLVSARRHLDHRRPAAGARLRDPARTQGRLPGRLLLRLRPRLRARPARPAHAHRARAASPAQRVRRLVLTLLHLPPVRLRAAARALPGREGAARRAHGRHGLQGAALVERVELRQGPVPRPRRLLRVGEGQGPVGVAQRPPVDQLRRPGLRGHPAAGGRIAARRPDRRALPHDDHRR